MRASTNKILSYFILACFLGACSPKTPAVPAEDLEVETVEEVASVSAPTPLENSQQAPAENASSAAQKTAPVKVEKQTQPEKTAPVYTIEKLMAELKKWEQNLKTFQADFNQVSSYDGVEINRSQGRLYYDFPAGLIRWEVLTKDGELDQVGISNKKEIVILDETLKPVTTLSWQEWQQGQANQALFDIGSYAQLSQKHDVKIVTQDNQKAVLAFTPKDEKEKYTLFITLSKKDFFPQEIAIEADDMLTTNELLSVHKNNTLSAELFGGFFK